MGMQPTGHRPDHILCAVTVIMVSNALWVYGLRPGYRFSRWRNAVVGILQDRYDGIGKTPATLEAEKGLGLEPSWYWYIARAESAFGHVVFLWSCEAAAADAGVVGACPFDTGGLWHGYIHGNPAIGPSARAELVRESSIPLRHWATRFHDYLRSNYDLGHRYVAGHSPRVGTPPIVNIDPPNSSRAWTWEGRVPVRRVAEFMRVVRMYCTDEDQKRLLDWIETDGRFDGEDRAGLTRWILENSVVTSRRERPVIAVLKDLHSMIEAP